MTARDPQLYLLHIRECCERILDYTAGLGTRWTDVSLRLRKEADKIPNKAANRRVGENRGREVNSHSINQIGVSGNHTLDFLFM